MSFYTDTVFPPLLGRVSRHFDDQRKALLSHAVGRVLEYGVGTGANLGFYPEDVGTVVGIDPHAAMIERARETAARLTGDGAGEAVSYAIELHRVDAARLPYDDGSFDTVVAFLTLCTVPDFRAAAREAHRVLRPGGRLLVLEHVEAETPMLRRVQRWLNPLWKRAAVGCHLDRDTGAALEAAGFDTTALERYRDDTFFPPTAPRIRGVLIR